MPRQLMNYHTALTSYQGFLKGTENHDGLAMLDIMKRYQTGIRKNGDPEWYHPLDTALYIRTLSGFIMYPPETNAAALGHDLLEDHPNSIHEINKRIQSPLILQSLENLSKFDRHGIKKSPEAYSATLAQDPIGSLVKGADRISNFQTMQGVFTLEKQEEYIEECETYILVMMKEASRRFTKQEQAYANIRHMLKSQIQLIEAIHETNRTQ